jgi:hypothetical protein
LETSRSYALLLIERSSAHNAVSVDDATAFDSAICRRL